MEGYVQAGKCNGIHQPCSEILAWSSHLNQASKLLHQRHKNCTTFTCQQLILEFYNPRYIQKPSSGVFFCPSSQHRGRYTPPRDLRTRNIAVECYQANLRRNSTPWLRYRKLPHPLVKLLSSHSRHLLLPLHVHLPMRPASACPSTGVSFSLHHYPSYLASPWALYRQVTWPHCDFEPRMRIAYQSPNRAGTCTTNRRITTSGNTES